MYRNLVTTCFGRNRPSLGHTEYKKILGSMFGILLTVYHYVGPQLATSQQLKVHATHTKNC
jgi:hypothetical protein